MNEEWRQLIERRGCYATWANLYLNGVNSFDSSLGVLLLDDDERSAVLVEGQTHEF